MSRNLDRAVENTAVLWMEEEQCAVTTAAFCSKYASPGTRKKILFALNSAPVFILSFVAHQQYQTRECHGVTVSAGVI